MKSLPKLKQIAQAVFNEFIRERDAAGGSHFKCISCGQIKEVKYMDAGLQFIELRSISFGRMSQKDFVSYVRDQLPVIYSEVIGRLYQKQDADRIIASVEDEYRKFLSKL